jgi:hypothetical protein
MNTLLQINDQWMNAPAGVVAFALTIAIGYMLKVSNFFPNNRIPAVVIPMASICFTVFQLCADLMTNAAHPWLNIPIHIGMGAVIGAVAWLFHAQILKRFVDSKFFNDDGSTKFFNNPNPPVDPASKP